MKTDFDTIPGVELANFAVNSNYLKSHKDSHGIGMLIFAHFVLPSIRKVSDEIGVRLIYIFSLPIRKLMNRYKEYGFKTLSDKDEKALHKRLKSTYDENCIFMYRIKKKEENGEKHLFDNRQ